MASLLRQSFDICVQSGIITSDLSCITNVEMLEEYLCKQKPRNNLFLWTAIHTKTIDFLDKVEWVFNYGNLYDMNYITHHKDFTSEAINYAFVCACKSENLDFILNYCANIECKLSINRGFGFVQRSNNIELAKLLFSLYKYDIEWHWDKYPLNNGNIEMFEWLNTLKPYSLPHISVAHVKPQHIMRVLKYVETSMNKRIDYSTIYGVACRNGNKEIMEYVYSGGKLERSIAISKLEFYSACYSGNIEAVKYLYNIKKMRTSKTTSKMLCITFPEFPDIYNYLLTNKSKCILPRDKFYLDKIRSKQNEFPDCLTIEKFMDF